MDVIEKDVAMLQDKGFDIKCDTQYWVQEKEHIDKWRIELEYVRIVMRHMVEVIL